MSAHRPRFRNHAISKIPRPHALNCPRRLAVGVPIEERRESGSERLVVPGLPAVAGQEEDAEWLVSRLLDELELGRSGRYRGVFPVPVVLGRRGARRGRPCDLGDRDDPSRAEEPLPGAKPLGEADVVDGALSPDDVEASVAERERLHTTDNRVDAIGQSLVGRPFTQAFEKRIGDVQGCDVRVERSRKNEARRAGAASDVRDRQRLRVVEAGELDGSSCLVVAARALAGVPGVQIDDQIDVAHRVESICLRRPSDARDAASTPRPNNTRREQRTM